MSGYGQFSESDYLRARGRHIYNARNERVFLRGTNLGGWLVQETWMAAYDGADSQYELIKKLTERFGKEEADALVRIWEDNFITGEDLDTIVSYGMNCVRVPFLWNTLVRGGSFDAPDFSRLDFIVEECGKRGLYVILDMHGVPGNQSVAHHCGRTRHCELYDDTPAGAEFRRKAAELWTEIAAHFRGNPVVAMLDLMNEPMCDNDPKISKKYVAVYDILYRAVRSADADRIITIEGIWTPFDLPDPLTKGWRNVVYQYHLYEGNDKEYALTSRTIRLPHPTVPVFIGEFCPARGIAKWENVIKAFNKAKFHYCTWTYKGFCKNSDFSDWFLIGASGSDKRIDLDTCTLDELKEKWTALACDRSIYRVMADGAEIMSY